MYKYFLPVEDNKPKEYTVENNSIIIVGANGAGKSRLGVWMEKNDLSNTHRISAQRQLELSNSINLKSYETSTNLLLTGVETGNNCMHDQRWGWDQYSGFKYETGILKDYEHALSALIAKNSLERDVYLDQCKSKDIAGQSHEIVPEFVIDKLKKIWNKIYPHRQIDIVDAKIKVLFSNSENSIEYLGANMSDGERVVLYLIAQCLSVPEGKIIIVDEPEIHIHRSIMNRLWAEIEKVRQDSLFIYITHDTQFASNHKYAKKIWIKSYNGINWDYQFVNQSQLPEQLLLDVLGNRKKVLFVEGTADSYDTKLYSEIYQDYYVVPCGGCSAVISQTKAMRNTTQLNHIECFGLIDRDYRNDIEIEAYKSHGIYTLGVAEVENLFLVEEILLAVNSLMAFTDNSRVIQIKDYIVNQRFANQINRQICEAVVSELKFQLSAIEISNNNETQAKADLSTAYNNISYETIQANIDSKFQQIKQTSDYKNILSVFNCKGLSTSIGRFFDLKNDTYCDYILRLLLGQSKEIIINAIIPYLPSEIPRT
ncbi:hypothetical protein DSECCO2_157280 [anaerobic digester metagenome]